MRWPGMNRQAWQAPQKVATARWNPGVRSQTVLWADMTPLISVVDVAGDRTPTKAAYFHFDPNTTSKSNRNDFANVLWNTIDFLAGRPPSQGRSPLLTG